MHFAGSVDSVKYLPAAFIAAKPAELFDDRSPFIPSDRRSVRGLTTALHALRMIQDVRILSDHPKEGTMLLSPASDRWLILPTWLEHVKERDLKSLLILH